MPYTVRKTVVAVCDSGHDGLFEIKENQPQLYQDCQLIQQEEPVADSFTSETEKAHGPIETGTVQLMHNFVATEPQWQGLFVELVCVQRTRKVLHTKTQEWKRSQENAF